MEQANVDNNLLALCMHIGLLLPRAANRHDISKVLRKGGGMSSSGKTKKYTMARYTLRMFLGFRIIFITGRKVFGFSHFRIILQPR